MLANASRWSLPRSAKSDVPSDQSAVAPSHRYAAVGRCLIVGPDVY